MRRSGSGLDFEIGGSPAPTRIPHRGGLGVRRLITPAFVPPAPEPAAPAASAAPGTTAAGPGTSEPVTPSSAGAAPAIAPREKAPAKKRESGAEKRKRAAIQAAKAAAPVGEAEEDLRFMREAQTVLCSATARADVAARCAQLYPGEVFPPGIGESAAARRVYDALSRRFFAFVTSQARRQLLGKPGASSAYSLGLSTPDVDAYARTVGAELLQRLSAFETLRKGAELSREVVPGLLRFNAAHTTVNVRGWLANAARMKMIDQVRAIDRQNKRVLPARRDRDGEELDPLADVAAPGLSPEEALRERQENEVGAGAPTESREIAPALRIKLGRAEEQIKMALEVMRREDLAPLDRADRAIAALIAKIRAGQATAEDVATLRKLRDARASAYVSKDVPVLTLSFQGHDYQRIARELGMPLGSVGRIKMRALERMRATITRLTAAQSARGARGARSV